jgi:hypothetical protein
MFPYKSVLLREGHPRAWGQECSQTSREHTSTRSSLLHPNMLWRHFTITSISFLCLPKHFCYLHMKTIHLVKLLHLDLLCNLSSGPRPWCPGLPSLVFWPNHKRCLVWGLSVPKPTISSPLPWTLIHQHLCGFMNLSNWESNLAQHLYS